MAYTLLDVLSSVPPESGVKARAVRRVIETSPFLNYMQFETRPDLMSRFFIDGALPTVDFRAYNTEASPSSGVPDEQYMQQLKTMSANIQIDLVLADVGTREGMAYKMREIDRHMRSFALTQKKRIVGKSNTATQNQGIYGWNQYYNSSSNPVIVDFAAAGSSFTAAGAGATVQAIQALIDTTQGLPAILFSNRALLRQVDYLATTANNVSLSQRFKWQEVMIAGKMQRIAYFDSFPWIPIDKDAQGNEIMPFDELSPNGATSNNTSMFSLRIGTDDYCLVQKQDSGPMVIESVQATKAVTNIEWPWGDESRHPQAIGRLRGIQA